MRKNIKILLVSAMILVSISIIAIMPSATNGSDSSTIFNPNKVYFNSKNNKEQVAPALSDLGSIQAKTEKKEIEKDDLTVEQVYKVYRVDWQKVLNSNPTDLDSILMETSDILAVYFNKDNSVGGSAIFSPSEANKSEQIISEVSEGANAKRLSNAFKNILKSTNIEDVKLIVHPSHDSNKLLYIKEKENDKKYIIPILVEGKDNEVGLVSYKKYTPEEILKNITEYLNKNTEK